MDVGNPAGSVNIGAQIVREYVDRDPYAGAYTITPSDEEQILDTKNFRMTDNITVKAVPSTYGHISWNGQHLSVY